MAVARIMSLTCMVQRGIDAAFPGRAVVIRRSVAIFGGPGVTLTPHAGYPHLADGSPLAGRRGARGGCRRRRPTAGRVGVTCAEASHRGGRLGLDRVRRR